MENLNEKIWVGFVINVLVALWGISDMAADGGTVAAVFITVMVGGLLLTGAGIAMLVRGDPAGGILGAVGSAIFVPIGLICLIGCLQCRDKLRSAAFTETAAPESRQPAAAETSAVAAAEPAEEEKCGGPESPAGSDGISATAAAPVVPAKAAPRSEGVAACEEAPAAATDETPLAAFGFADERAWGWTLVLGSVALFFFALYHGTSIMSGSVVCFIMGIVRLVQSRQRLGRHACILYRDHLECVSGVWTSDLVSIPYASIREARYSGSRLRLQLASGDGTTKFAFYFALLASDKRDEARTVLQDKMRELGVLREH